MRGKRALPLLPATRASLTLAELDTSILYPWPVVVQVIWAAIGLVFWWAVGDGGIGIRRCRAYQREIAM